MTPIKITLPDAMQQFVEDRVEAGGYANVSDYFRDLVRGDQKRQAKEQMEQVLLAALSSGDPDEITPEMLDQTQYKLRSGKA